MLLHLLQLAVVDVAAVVVGLLLPAGVGPHLLVRVPSEQVEVVLGAAQVLQRELGGVLVDGVPPASPPAGAGNAEADAASRRVGGAVGRGRPAAGEGRGSARGVAWSAGHGDVAHLLEDVSAGAPALLLALAPLVALGVGVELLLV